ncbi:MAG TPA: hypothetical protein VMF12_00240 [Xanthobacteraceae bacterium]|nr:hypothetical protein [Xanthobacteraceae bacterium]
MFGAPSVNLEFAFSDAAKYFSNGDPQYLEQYFHYEANTLAVPWLAYAIHWLFPGLDIDHIPRLLSIFGIPFLAYGLLRINRQFAQRINPYILVSVVLLNPLVWAFAGRGTADFLPAALAVFAFSLFGDNAEEAEQGLGRRALASVVLGISAVIKYHAIILLAGVVAEVVIRRRTQYGRILLECAVSALPAALVVAAYLLIVKFTFGFWLTPPRFQQMHGLNLAAAPDNFISYAGFLILITVPLSLAILRARPIEFHLRSGAALLLVSAAFVAGYFFLSDNGEMNLGPLDPYIDKHLLNGALAALACIFAIRLAIGVERSISSGNDLARACGLATGIIVFMLALSLTRPAQRYLLFIVPLFYFFIFPVRKHSHLLLAFTIALSIVLDVYILLNQTAFGIASERMAQRIAALGLTSKTVPGAIEGNVGDLFFQYRNDEKTFMVVPGDVAGNIAMVHYSVLPGLPFIGKTYSLVPLRPSH